MEKGKIMARDPWSDLDTNIPLAKLEKESFMRDDGKYFNFFTS